ncbi:MAG: hypothetical protein JWM86_246 [Thermoleophilia bacterium]|nr:hypothetical protein [Thermoleophilia bacterium]
MECWTCADPAVATCRFCGRATCRRHAQSLPFVLTAWGEADGHVHSLVVEDAIHCGGCRPHPAPVRLDLVLQETDT